MAFQRNQMFAERNALAFDDGPQDDVAGTRHVSKHKLKQKGLEISFDPQAHRDFVTGFHKRKQHRRKEAQRHLEKKAHEQRLEERAQRRAQLKERLDLVDGPADQPAPDPAAAAAQEACKTYICSGGVSSVVRVGNIQMHSESEGDQNEANHDEGEDEATATRGTSAGTDAKPCSFRKAPQPKEAYGKRRGANRHDRLQRKLKTKKKTRGGQV